MRPSGALERGKFEYNEGTNEYKLVVEEAQSQDQHQAINQS